MKYCIKCGNPLSDDMNFCPKCGSAQNNSVYKNYQQSAANQPQDAKSFGFAVLGFFFPVVGLILYLVWKDQMPLKAKSAGKGALASLIASTVFAVLAIVASVILGVAGLSGVSESGTFILPIDDPEAFTELFGA